MTILPIEYYRHHDVLYLSRDLLGKCLMTQIGSHLTGGMIIETEAYRGPEDRASHAYNNRRTKRTETMFQQGGVCYVYQCYGIHSLFNVITNEAGIPHAILIRAIKPMFGLEEMLRRRHKKTASDRILTGGPGTLTQALGITTRHNGLLLNKPPIWIEDRGYVVPAEAVKTTARIGIDYAKEDALLPWRFLLTSPESLSRRDNSPRSI